MLFNLRCHYATIGDNMSNCQSSRGKNHRDDGNRGSARGIALHLDCSKLTVRQKTKLTVKREACVTRRPGPVSLRTLEAIGLQPNVIRSSSATNPDLI
ncbi:hypothetical protein TNCV_899081 [Trichonephila clavipes]|nr:hypothetical protein TNCV_899081 [Trichonephila clavipes]